MGKINLLKIFILLAIIFSISEICWAEPTKISIRVISKGAKFIGSNMGGVKITLQDAQTGELLATGKTQGGTGNTKRIMKQDHSRGYKLSTDDAAKFSATLDLDEPRLIEVTAFGPLAKLDSANRVSSTQWVVPGKHLTGGDGWLLQMPGFVVEVLTLPMEYKLEDGSKEIELKVNVTMMCGCPIKPGGIWDANRYEVKALVKRDGVPAGNATFSYAGSTSQFSGTLHVKEPGIYKAIIYAYDPNNGNTGLDTITFKVSR
ncbi:MAG: hypothetical protein ACQ9MH_11780 [Nitrospinales bacterium]